MQIRAKKKQGVTGLTGLVLAILLIPWEGSAFKPYFPDEKEFAATDGSAVLTITKKDWTGRLEEKKPNKTHKWKGEVHYPSRHIFVPSLRRLALLGGHGDPGLRLGIIDVYSYEGKLLHTVDLTKRIEGLEEMARAFSEVSGPFPWISKLALDGNLLHVGVCEKKNVTVDISSFDVTVK